ncbi:hypothetical protein L7F22_068518, partial [Adiantum nelumboides]|nr:hypothetical protein [Adiantum nelumboides]
MVSMSEASEAASCELMSTTSLEHSSQGFLCHCSLVTPRTSRSFLRQSSSIEATPYSRTSNAREISILKLRVDSFGVDWKRTQVEP